MAELLLARIVLGATRAFELGEKLLLERQLFRRCFEDKCRVLHRRQKRIVARDAAEQRRIVVEQIDNRVKSLRQRSANVRRRLEYA